MCRAASSVVPALAAMLILALLTTLPAHAITPTSTSLSSAANPAPYGQPVTFTAAVSSALGTPTGKVTFMNGSEILHTATLAGSVASYVTAKLPVGTASITAAYAGNAKFAGSTSAALAQEVTQGASAVTLSSTVDPSVYGQPVTFTAAVSSASGKPTGTVTFMNGGAILHTEPFARGVASMTTDFRSLGTLSITAVYNGSADILGSTSAVLNQVVNAAPTTVTLSSSANPALVGQPVTFTATVTAPFRGIPTGEAVLSTANTALGVGSLTGGVASVTTSSLVQGITAITATYLPAANFSGSSATLAQTVQSAGPQSYTLAASPLNPGSTTAGNTSASSLILTPVNGYAGSVTLSCSVSGSGTPAPGCAFSPPAVTLSGVAAGTSALTVSTTGSTPAGTYGIAVTGADANAAAPSNGPQMLTLQTRTAGSPSYTLTASALSPASITAGSTSASAITVTPANGYTGSVNLSCSVTGVISVNGAPGPACTFSPSAVTLSGAAAGTSELTVSTSGSTPAGAYVITVTGADANALAPNNGYQPLTLTTASVIQHVVIIMQENRTPDNLFQDPVLIARGADIASSGVNSLGQTIALTPIDLGTAGSSPLYYDLDHSHPAFESMYDGGKMDGADLIRCTPLPLTVCPPNAQFAYVMPADVQPYFAMAEQYTFGDRMFQSNEGPSYPAHQFILAGTSAPTATSTLFASEDPPLGRGGCVGPPTHTVSMIDAAGSETSQPPEYACFEHPTLSDLLEAQGLTWRYYAATPGPAWNAPISIEHICQPQTVDGKLNCTGPEWINGVTMPQTQVLTDIANGQLAQVTWVTPNGFQSDHGDVNDGSGPSWVASIVNAIGTSPYWANTAILITWDDWGGWYDHVAPTVIDDGVSWGSGYVYGFRVPLVVVSPYAKAAYISHVTHDFGSILNFVESTFNLPSLGYADAFADNLADCFDLSQTPIPFQVISAPLGAPHFINDKRPPTDPDDD